MEILGTLFSVVMLIGFAAAGYFFSKKMGASVGAASADYQAEANALNQRLGFRPVGPQRAVGATFGKIHMVRMVGDKTVHYEQETRQTGSGYAMSNHWWVEGIPTFVGIHLAPKRLTSRLKGLKEQMTNIERDFSPRFANEISIPHPALAAQYRAWGNDPQGWLANEGFAAAILALAEVELYCQEGRATVNDPFMKNLAPPEGPMAMMRLSPGQRSEVAVQGHDRVAFLLTNLG